MAIFAKDFDARIAGGLQQVEELDTSRRCPTRDFWSIFNFSRRIAPPQILVPTAV